MQNKNVKSLQKIAAAINIGCIKSNTKKDIIKKLRKLILLET